jgi:hypothetical protein
LKLSLKNQYRVITIGSKKQKAGKVMFAIAKGWQTFACGVAIMLSR